MLRDTDVPTMMMRVEATLDAAARSSHGARGVMQVAAEGDRRVNVGKARRLAAIEVEFPASSDRAYVGAAISFAKRALRRSMRWYVTPMIDQQSRFNHTAVDLFESLRLSVDRLARRLDAADGTGADDLFRGCRDVVEIGDGSAPALLPDGAPVRAAADAAQLGAASVDGLLAHGAALDAAGAAALVESAFDALRPGGRLAVLTADDAPVPPAAVAWALRRVGFTHVRQEPVDAVNAAPTSSLADDLERVTRLLRQPGLVAVTAVRPKTP